MRALDHDMIMDLYQASVRVEGEQDEKVEIACHLFAVKPTWQDEIVLVANRSLLIEWPIELVDTTAPSFKKLLRAAQAVPEKAAMLIKDPWSIQIMSKVKDGKLVFNKTDLQECEEIEPVEEGVFSYRTSAGLTFHFNRHYKGMLDRIWPAHLIDGEPSASTDSKIYVRFGKVQEGILIISENGRRRGALANARI